MLVSSSGKHTIPLSSRRQRNIPQGRTRGEFEIRPQETGQATSVHVLLCLSDSGLLTSALNSRHFSRKYMSVCLSQPACRSGRAAAFPSFQPGSAAHIPAGVPGLVQGMAGLANPKGMPRKPFCITKKAYSLPAVFQIALGQGWVKQRGRNWEITPWPCPWRHKVLLKPGEAHAIGIPQDSGLYPFMIPNAAFSILSRPLPVT